MRDGQLLLVRISAQLENLHAVSKRCRDRVEQIRRGNEHDLRQVKRNVKIVVSERVVLLGIEHLEQRRRGIAAPVASELVDLVQNKDRVARSGTSNRLNDSSRHRANVGPAVSANLGLVSHPAERHSGQLSTKCVGDRLRKTRLADTRRTDKAEDRLARLRRLRLAGLGRGLLLQLAHRQILENAVLDLLQVVVLVVENLARLGDVDLTFGPGVPGQGSSTSRDTS